MSELNNSNFDIKPLMNNIEKVIEYEINKLLSNHIERYNLLEKTHQMIMKLPSVVLELGKLEDNEDNINFNNDTFSTNKVHENLSLRLDDLERKYDNIVPILSKLVEKISFYNNEIKNFKKHNVNEDTINNIEKSSVVKTSENENIEIYFEEKNISEEEKPVVKTEIIEKPDEDEDEDEEEEEVEEEDEEVEEVEEVQKEKVEEVQKEKVEDEEEEEEDEEVDEEEEDEEVDEEVEEDTSSIETETKEEDEDEEEEIFEIEIDDVTYCTNNDENGFIWELTEDGEQGEKIGYFKDSEPFFYADEK